MKKIFASIITITLLYIGFGCDTPQNGIVVENNTDHDIYCVISTLYPDTTIKFIDKESMTIEPMNFLKARTTKSISNLTYCEKYTWDTYIQSGTMIVFVFDKYVVDNTDWAVIVKNHLIFRKYYLNYTELQKRKCRITVE